MVFDSILAPPQSSVKLPIVESCIDALSMLPLWVKLWVAVLGSTHMAAFVFVTTTPGLATLLANVVSGSIGVYLIVRTRSFGKILSASHIIGWTPLLAYLVYYIFTTWDRDGAAPLVYAICVVTVTWISLEFDVYDLYLWVWAGQREVPHSEAFKVKYGLS